jgi:hypothetical protein
MAVRMIVSEGKLKSLWWSPDLTLVCISANNGVRLIS